MLFALLGEARQVSNPELEKLIGDTGTDLQRVLAYYKIAALAEMTETTYQRALEVLNRKLGNRRQRETVHAQD